MRTGESVFKVSEFGGVNDLLDSLKLPPGFVPWSHGGYYNERKQFARMKGKRVYTSTSTSMGHVLTLQQVVLKTRSVVVVRHASTVYYEDDLSSFRTEADVPDPMEAFIP